LILILGRFLILGCFLILGRFLGRLRD